MTSANRTGRCYCSAVQFIATGDPTWVSHCHCESCRRHSGSAMTTFAGFHPQQVNFSGAAPGRFSPGNGVTRSFCQQCGSPVAYQHQDSPDEIHVYLGLFDDPEQLRPEDHSFYAEKISWMEMDDDLPRHEGLTAGSTNR